MAHLTDTKHLGFGIFSASAVTCVSDVVLPVTV